MAEDKAQQWTAKDIPDQHGRVVVITGANSGIGLETARELAGKGATVVMACRNMEKAQQAAADIYQTYPEAQLSLHHLDLDDLTTIDPFISGIQAIYPVVNVLINNAGVMVPPLGKTKQGFERQFGVNHLGHFVLTKKMLPMLCKTPGARIVIVSSNAHRMGKMDFDNLNAEKSYKKWPAYAQSKLANLLFMRELNKRLPHMGCDVIAVAAHPGTTRTNLSNNMASMSARLFSMMSQEQAMGALPTLYAATMPEVKANDYFGPRGFMEITGYPKKVDMTGAAKDEAAAKRLWDASEALTGTTYPTAS